MALWRLIQLHAMACMIPFLFIRIVTASKQTTRLLWKATESSKNCFKIIWIPVIWSVPTNEIITEQFESGKTMVSNHLHSILASISKAHQHTMSAVHLIRLAMICI